MQLVGLGGRRVGGAEAGAVVRTPGAAGQSPPEDGLGADALYAATPGIADELRALAVEHGAGRV